MTASRSVVRDTVAAYFGGVADPLSPGRYTGGPLPVLGAVYTVPPAAFTEADLYAGQGPGSPSGVVGVVRLPRSIESRVAGGTGAGWKRVGYEATLDVYHLFTEQDTGKATDDLDVFLESLTALLRADPTLGGAVFSAGEGDASRSGGMASRVEVTVGEPLLTGAGVETFASVGFGVVVHFTA